MHQGTLVVSFVACNHISYLAHTPRPHLFHTMSLKRCHAGRDIAAAVVQS